MGTNAIQLLATDLDGTLIGSATEFPLYTSFREKISELKRDYSTVWVACTGRDLSSFRSFFSPMRTMGLGPEFVVVKHAYIFERTRAGYMPHLIWNLRIAYIIWLNRMTARGVLAEWHDTITGVSVGVSTLKKTKTRMLLRFDSEDAARVAEEVLQEKLKEYRHLQIFRSKDEVDVRAVPFTKGLAVSELARHLGIDKKEILTIGNGHNDISMLSSDVAGMYACPSNSETEVLHAVHEGGGHVSRERSLGGVMDSINAYLTDAVDSSLPQDISDTRDEPRPIKRRRSGRKRRRRGVPIKQKLIAAGMIYAVLVVFANFRLIPFVSSYIMWPYKKVLGLLEALFVQIMG